MMFSGRKNFLVKISNLNKDGLIIDPLSNQTILKIKNNSLKDIFSKILNVITFRLIGKIEFDFLIGDDVAFKLVKDQFKSSIYLKYPFEGNFYDLYRIETFGSFLPIVFSFNIFEGRNLVFMCRRKKLLEYEVVDRNNLVFATIYKAGSTIFEDSYNVNINNFLDANKNYIFLALPVVISVFY